MEDRLKKYTDARRQDFEGELPPELDGLWENIADALDKREGKNRTLWTGVSRTGVSSSRHVWRAAAAVLLAFGLGWALWPTAQAPQDEMADFQEAQQFYQSQIDEQLAVLQAKNGQIDPIVLENLAAVDQAIQELKEDLKDEADNEEVVNAMIQSYQLKLKLLEEILQQIKKQDDANIEVPAA